MIAEAIAAGAALTFIASGLSFVARRRRAEAARDEAALEAMGSELGIDRMPGEDVDTYRHKVIVERDRRAHEDRNRRRAP